MSKIENPVVARAFDRYPEPRRRKMMRPSDSWSWMQRRRRLTILELSSESLNTMSVPAIPRRL